MSVEDSTLVVVSRAALEEALLPPVPVGSVSEPAGLRVYEGGEDL